MVLYLSLFSWECMFWELILFLWQVKPATTVKPSPRYLTGVVLHQDRLCMFGGAGHNIVTGQDPGAKYQPREEENGVVHDLGWNNEYYEFNLKTCECISILMFRFPIILVLCVQARGLLHWIRMPFVLSLLQPLPSASVTSREQSCLGGRAVSRLSYSN